MFLALTFNFTINIIYIYLELMKGKFEILL